MSRFVAVLFRLSTSPGRDFNLGGSVYSSATLNGRRTSGNRKYPVAEADNAHVPEKRAGRRYGYADRRVKDGGRSFGTGFARNPPNRGLNYQGEPK